MHTLGINTRQNSLNSTKSSSNHQPLYCNRPYHRPQNPSSTISASQSNPRSTNVSLPSRPISPNPSPVFPHQTTSSQRHGLLSSALFASVFLSSTSALCKSLALKRLKRSHQRRPPLTLRTAIKRALERCKDTVRQLGMEVVRWGRGEKLQRRGIGEATKWKDVQGAPRHHGARRGSLPWLVPRGEF